MTELARRLDDLGTSLAFPPTPDLPPAVLARISRRRRRRRAVVLALAAAAATIVTALALSPGARSAVQRLIGIGGVQIELVDELPATPVRARPDFGAEVSLAEARRLAGFRVRLPALAGLGEPDAVFFRDYPTGMVTIVYGPIDEPRLALTEWRGATVETVAIKVVPAGTTVDYVRVRGALGIWLSGAPHLIFGFDREGAGFGENLRLAGNVLVWERRPLAFRLETALPRAAALAIATSVR